jgi:hypothetical protein
MAVKRGTDHPTTVALSAQAQAAETKPCSSPG